MKAGERKQVSLTTTGGRYELRPRFEQNVPGAIFFDCLISGDAAVGPHTPLGLIVATPTVLGVPRDFAYDISIWQGVDPSWTDVISNRQSSAGGQASAKINCWVDSAQPVTIKVFSPASWKRYIRVFGMPLPWTVWEPLMTVFIQAKHLQGVIVG